MKRVLLAALLLAAVLCGCSGVSGQPADDDPILLEFEAQTWQLACAGGKNSIDAQTADYFAQLVYRETNGAVTVEYSTGAAPADDSTDLSLFSSLLWADRDPRFGVLSLPFLFDSEADAAAVLDGAGGEALAAILLEYGQHCIGIGSGGFRCLTNNLRPIAAPADLSGLRIRVEDSPLLREAYSLWGAECVTADWPLVYTALRTGTYDGQEMPPEAADASSIQDVQSHATRWTGLYSGMFFCMDKTLYDSLSPTLREIVDTCGQKTVAYQRQLLADATASILSRWSRAGVTVTELTAENAAAFRAAAQPCYDRFAQGASADLAAIFAG